jgi:hypothetical protein
MLILNDRANQQTCPTKSYETAAFRPGIHLACRAASQSSNYSGYDASGNESETSGCDRSIVRMIPESPSRTRAPTEPFHVPIFLDALAPLDAVEYPRLRVRVGDRLPGG